MIRGIQNVSIPAIRYAMAQGGKMSVPVEPAYLMYSQFEHVSGKAAPQGTDGVSINRIKLLDVLIRQLNQAKKDALTIPAGSAIPAEHLQTLIDNYRAQVLETKAASAVIPYIPSPSAPGGAVFTLVA